MHVLAAHDGRGGKRQIDDEKQHKVQSLSWMAAYTWSMSRFALVVKPYVLALPDMPCLCLPLWGRKGRHLSLATSLGDLALSFILGFLEIPS